jgi:glycosyltransferase involved in cell wall biosynthesis
VREAGSLTKTMITIITPSYNRAGMIASAVESVLAQNLQSFEHIIIDGGSTDGTLEILKRYPHLKVLSGLDRGMYDALNRGLDIASGEIIGFLNTDDLYEEGIFPMVAGKFDDPDVMAVAGRAIVFSQLPDGKIRIVRQYSPLESDLMECSTVGSNFFNAWFFRQSTFDQIGTFNTSYKIVGDQDLMLRFALNNLKYIVINDLVYKYRVHKDSLTFDKSSEKLARSADESLTMTDFYLADQNLPNLTRKLLIQRRTLRTVHMAARSIWMWNYKKFVHYSIEGLRYNRAWPVSFFQYALKKGFEMIWTKGPGGSFQ